MRPKPIADPKCTLKRNMRSDGFADFAYVISYLHLKDFAWRGDKAIS